MGNKKPAIVLPVSPFSFKMFSSALKYMGNLPAQRAALASIFSFGSAMRKVPPIRLVMSVQVSMTSSILAHPNRSSLVVG